MCVCMCVYVCVCMYVCVCVCMCVCVVAYFVVALEQSQYKLDNKFQCYFNVLYIGLPPTYYTDSIAYRGEPISRQGNHVQSGGL